MNRLGRVRVSSLRLLILSVVIFIQCYNVPPVRSSHQLNNPPRHSASTEDRSAESSKTVLPVWVIIVIVLLILMALCFCIGLCCYRFGCSNQRYYGGRRRRTRVVRITTSHINHKNFQGIERTGDTVCLSGEDPINKEIDKPLSSTLYQSEAPPRYEDVVQAKSTELDEGLDDQCDHGSIHHIHRTKSPPPNYQ